MDCKRQFTVMQIQRLFRHVGRNKTNWTINPNNKGTECTVHIQITV